MEYREFLPNAYLSRHIECFWEMELLPNEVDQPFEAWSPDCTFDLIFCDIPASLRFAHKQKWEKLPAQATLLGQRTSSIQFQLSQPLRLFGIRFKPFAFANLLRIPCDQMTNKLLPMSDLFPISKDVSKQIQRLLAAPDVESKNNLAEGLLLTIFDDQWDVDETFRAQVNYLLDRKGMVQIQDLTSEFDVSKVTLCQHFIRKMGLTPKKVARIWRLNYFLQLQQSACMENLTALGLTVGYYDQSHCIREFQAFFRQSPLQVFRQKSQLLSVSQQIIARRFSNQYDPR